MDAKGLIRTLDLRPHPEGGHYRETFRDPRTDAGGRALSTALLFLRLHRGAWLHLRGLRAGASRLASRPARGDVTPVRVIMASQAIQRSAPAVAWIATAQARRRPWRNNACHSIVA